MDAAGRGGHVVVTGAGGFIGRALVSRLRAMAVPVVGVDISAAGVPEGVPFVEADVRDPGAFADVLIGATAVVHTAALVSNVAPLKTAWDINVRGTAAVLQAAADTGVPRFVHVSSIAVYGFDFPHLVDESYPLRVSGFSYPDTKVAAEATVLAAHSRGDIETVIVRPGDVYGPESRPWVLEPLRIIRARQAFLPRGGRGVFSPVYVDNLVDGIIAATMTPEASGRIYNLTDGMPVTCGAYFGELATWVGGKVRTMPARPVFALASTMGALQRAVGRDSELCGASMHMLNRRGSYSIERARGELGYSPAVDLAEGLSRTRQWWQARG